ncbi:MAG: metallophosphoesterase, partial [Desulfovibrionaceae bacterium]|nr:metallophosphoesterase [Desulfovibrionaceae bacterium]
MLRLISTVLPLYLIIRLILPLRSRLWLKFLLSLALVLCAAKYPLFELFYGTFTPPLPRWAMLLTGISHGAAVVLTALCLGRDLLLAGWWLARKFRPALPPCTIGTGQWAAGLTLLSLLLACAAVWQGSRVPEVRRISLALPQLPPALEGLRLAHLSDTHISPCFGQDWVRAVVHQTNALKPDLIVITGDLADGQPAQLESAL